MTIHESNIRPPDWAEGPLRLLLKPSDRDAEEFVVPLVQAARHDERCPTPA